jgi:sialate O-acetylesterase
MKKFLLTILVGSFSFAVFGQVLLDDFDGNQMNGIVITKWATYSPEVVANPLIEGLNTSNNVMSFPAHDFYAYYMNLGGFLIFQNIAPAIFNDNNYVSFKYLVQDTTSAADVITIQLKIERGAEGAIYSEILVIDVPAGTKNKWEEAAIAIPRNADSSPIYFNQLDFIISSSLKPAIPFYLDDITFTASIVRPQIISLPNVFGNNMVIQQDTMASLWGWAPPDEDVVITASWGQTVSAKADTDWKWSAKIQTPKAIAGEAPKYALNFKGINNEITLENVLVGDIWICSGQSNMEFMMGYNQPWTELANFQAEIANANYPNIRLFTIPRTGSPTPASNCRGSWNECNPTTVEKFSAAAYFFGREIYNNTNTKIPIGLLETAYGGSNCQAWTSRAVLEADTEFKAKYLTPYDANPTAGEEFYRPTVLYNGMIAPLIPLNIKGFLWYQGESNVDDPIYTKLCTAMLQDWRKSFGKSDLPFYYVQLAPYSADPSNYSSYNTAIFRELQSNMQAVPNTGMAVTIDLADEVTNVHPHNKQDVGKRLALLALSKTYGENILNTGPIFESFAIEGRNIRISFKPETLGGGLITTDGKNPATFRIAGADKKFYNALAVIDGNEVIVYSSFVTSPVAVRYAFSNAPVPNLKSVSGFPVYPFRTDVWTGSTYMGNTVTGVEKTDESQSFQLFPNPFDKEIILKSEAGIKQINLFDISGSAIGVHSKNEQSMVTLETEDLKSGFYMLQITKNDGQTQTMKLIKN